MIRVFTCLHNSSLFLIPLRWRIRQILLYRLMNTVTVNFNTDVRKMTEMSRRKKTARKSFVAIFRTEGDKVTNVSYSAYSQPLYRIDIAVRGWRWPALGGGQWSWQLFFEQEAAKQNVTFGNQQSPSVNRQSHLAINIHHFLIDSHHFLIDNHHFLIDSHHFLIDNQHLVMDSHIWQPTITIC